ncbi:MAG: DUF5050 domain-containing protein [Clostridia bacterium]|nr:DUF5050 domain-containing protein [Clostridia bacterium]
MRCRRCHTKLDSSKKMCPVCGTLVRKKRGKVKLAPQAGAGNKIAMPMNNIFSRMASLFESKILIAVIALLVIVAAVVTMIATGAFDGCSCSCGGDDTYEEIGSVSVNSATVSREYYIGTTLYYVSGNNLMSLDDNGTTTVVAAGSGIGGVTADSENVYYLQGGDIWVSPLEKPLTVSDDPAAKYASTRIVGATASGSDAGVTSVTGYALIEGGICYWGPAEGGTAIYTHSFSSGGRRMLFTGPCANIQCYRGKVYYVSQGAADSGVLHSIGLDSGETSVVYDETQVKYYALSDGNAMIYSDDEESGVLSRVKLRSGEVSDQWRTERFQGMAANDSYIYYHTTSGDGSALYRMEAGGSESVKIFYDGGKIRLCGIAGDYFSLWVGLTDSDNPYSGASYYIFNSETREQIALA